MEFVKTSLPEPSAGVDYSKEIDQVVPDQSMSLQEILERFTRGEPLDVDMGGEFSDEEDFDNPLSVDLEKLKHADLVEKAEYAEKLNEVKQKYEKQEAAKSAKAAKIAAEKAEQEKADAIEKAVQERLKKPSA